MNVVERIDFALTKLAEACRRVYGDRLVSVVAFGSVGRGTINPYSDIDVLVIASELPRGRLRRVDEFREVEKLMQPALQKLASEGWNTTLSPVIKSPEEALRGSALFLDMTTDARILVDKDAFFESVLERLKRRLAELGAKKIPYKGGWYWDLKPDYKPGDIIEI